ncbi:MAG: hypothetical protein K0S65_6401, partial [Labilithrix sp.]|nr:hypothetical protein [Labilithrix sp.]
RVAITTRHEKDEARPTANRLIDDDVRRRTACMEGDHRVGSVRPCRLVGDVGVSDVDRQRTRQPSLGCATGLDPSRVTLENGELLDRKELGSGKPDARLARRGVDEMGPFANPREPRKERGELLALLFVLLAEGGVRARDEQAMDDRAHVVDREGSHDATLPLRRDGRERRERDQFSSETSPRSVARLASPFTFTRRSEIE